jgi:hypothetical protein
VSKQEGFFVGCEDIGVIDVWVEEEGERGLFE